MALIIALCLLAPLEAALALRSYWYTQAAYQVHIDVMGWLIRGGVALAALLAQWPEARRWAAAHLGRLGTLERRRHAAWAGLAFLGVAGLFFFLKYCQYRGFQLPADSAGTANVVYNLAHGRGFFCPVFGVASHFAVHFIPFFALLAPLVLVWKGFMPLLLFQVLLTASIPAAAYVLAWRRSGSSLAALCAFWLVFSSPYLFNIAAASVYPGMYLSAFFLWAMCGVELGSWPLAAVSLLLMALSIEQACLALFGLGLYLVWRLGWRERRSWLLGGAACAGAALLFVLEVKLKGSYPEAERFRSWGMFSHLGATPGAAVKAALGAPAAFLARLVWPLSKLDPLLMLFESTGLMPLLAPWTLIPFAVNFAPSFLAGPGDVYHVIRLQYAGYFLGPLWWSASLGLARAHGWLEKRGLAPWLLVGTLALGSFNFWRGPNVLLRDWMRPYFTEAPILSAMIPEKAGVWTVEYASAWVSGRSHLKVLPYERSPVFEGQLFVPDYVLMDRAWPNAANAELRGRVLTFFDREGYVKAAELSQLVLLKRPGELAGSPQPLALPEAGKRAAAYGDYVWRNDDFAATARAWRRAAEGGDAQAQHDLGTACYLGQGVPRDPEEAFRWWEKAAAQGIADSQNNLATHYLEQGNAELAAEWFRKAAEKGNAFAQKNLGVCYATGKGVAQNHILALGWFRRAAEGGNAEAQYNVAVYMLNGAEGAPDVNGAVALLKKAAAGGQPDAKRKLAQLGR